MKELLGAEARDDFNRARKNAFFSEVFNLFSESKRELLSLQEVKDILKPRGETYRGMQTVPIERIVGSEG
ncbi:MAG: transcriptional regulator, partial [Alkalispirochaeta sp.]